MALTDYQIELPDELLHRLEEYPVVLRSRKIDQAINAALDAAGFPGGTVEPEQFYVNVWTILGHLKGHVGPISSRSQALKVEASWQKSGSRAQVSSIKLGTCLTAQFSIADGLYS